jgi:hypothetical protein
MVSQGSPAPIMNKMNPVIGAQQSQTSGQAVLRLLQFAEQLSPGQEEVFFSFVFPHISDVCFFREENV